MTISKRIQRSVLFKAISNRMEQTSRNYRLEQTTRRFFSMRLNRHPILAFAHSSSQINCLSFSSDFVQQSLQSRDVFIAMTSRPVPALLKLAIVAIPWWPADIWMNHREQSQCVVTQSNLKRTSDSLMEISLGFQFEGFA
jgi:hypothetical protein